MLQSLLEWIEYASINTFEFEVGTVGEYPISRDLNWYVDTFRRVYLSKHKRKPKKTILKPLKNRKKCSSKVILFFKKQIVLTLNRAQNYGQVDTTYTKGRIRNKTEGLGKSGDFIT